MKINYLVIGVTLFFTGCASVSQNKFVKNENVQFKTFLTPEFEKLDTSAFTIMHRRVTYKDTFHHSAYLVGNRDTTLYKFSSEGETLTIYDGYRKPIKTIEKRQNYFVLYEYITRYLYVGKKFYANGNISSKGTGSSLGFSVGKSYWFDKEGKLTKEKDNDEGFNFTFNDLIKFCNKNKISLEKDNAGNPVFVDKRIRKDGTHIWSMEVFYPKANGRKIINIDGKTGHIIGITPVPLRTE